MDARVVIVTPDILKRRRGVSLFPLSSLLSVHRYAQTSNFIYLLVSFNRVEAIFSDNKYLRSADFRREIDKKIVERMS